MIKDTLVKYIYLIKAHGVANGADDLLSCFNKEGIIRFPYFIAPVTIDSGYAIPAAPWLNAIETMNSTNSFAGIDNKTLGPYFNIATHN